MSKSEPGDHSLEYHDEAGRYTTHSIGLGHDVLCNRHPDISG